MLLLILKGSHISNSLYQKSIGRGTFSLLLMLHLGGSLSSSAFGALALFPCSKLGTPFGLSVFAWGMETHNSQ